MNTPNKQKKKAKVKAEEMPGFYNADFKHLNKQHTELVMMRTEESILFQANYNYYNRWLRRNQPEVNRMNELRRQIDKDCFQHITKEDGTVDFIYENEKKEGLPLFNEGKTKADFEEACRVLGETKCIVIP